MEDSRSSHRHCNQSRLGAGGYSGALTRRQTSLRDILQTPIPIVIVVRAKLCGAFSQFVPRNTIERHAHIMLAGYPRCHFRLFQQNKNHSLTIPDVIILRLFLIP